MMRRPIEPIPPDANAEYWAGIRDAMAGAPRPPPGWRRRGWDVQMEDEHFDQWLKETGTHDEKQQGPLAVA